MTIANKITLTRIFLGLLVFLMLWMKSTLTVIIAIGLFAAATASDYIDGFIARRTKTTTSFGAIADPFADKILIMAAFLAFVAIRELNVPLWAVFIIMIRELTISTLRALAALHGKVMKADKYGKFKTLTQMTASATIMLLLLLITLKKDPSSLNAALKWTYFKTPVISFWLATVAAVVTLISGIIYIHNNYNLLKASWSAKN